MLQTASRFSCIARAGVLALAVVAALPAGSTTGQTQPAPATRVAPSATPLDGLPIQRVEVVGNTRTPTNVILAQVRTAPGQRYSQALVDLDNRSIAALDIFLSVYPEVVTVSDTPNGPVTGVIVRFVVEERPLVNSVQIAGNRAIKDSDIREGLSTIPGKALDRSRIRADRTFILNLYKKKGYAQASVDVDEKLLNEQGIVKFQIIEGPITRITKIEIDGNVALSDDYIKWRISTKTYFWIFRKGTLDEDMLQRDVGAIRDMYEKKGYLDVRVSYTLDYSEDKSKVTVHFVVLEGQQYHVGKITLTGNTEALFPTAALLGDLSRFGPGSVVERDKVDLLKKHIDDRYDEKGYIEHSVEIHPAYTSTPGVVDLNITIVEGKPYIVGLIIVRGNSEIQDRVVRRQIRIYPDQTFDMVQVRKSLDRLRATGIISDPKITPIIPPGNPQGDVRDALVQVSEGKTGSYNFGVGISTNSGLVGQFSLEQKNFDILNFPHSMTEMITGQSFKGAGQYFNLLLEPGTEFQRYRLTFAEPYLFDSPYSFSNDLYFFTRARESWDERRIGELATFGRRFSDVWGVTLALRAEQVTLSNPQDLFNDRVTQDRFPVVGPNGSINRVSDTAQEILNEIGSHFVTSIKPAVVYDTTDSRTFPSTGFLASLGIEQYGALGGDVTMTKFVIDFNWYRTLYTDLFDRKTVFALRNDIGLIPFGTSPTYERFYLGGIPVGGANLRGFKYRGVSPHSGPLNDPIGGDFSWVTTAEVNYPIYEELLRGVVFLDVGTVERDITISNIRSDVGLGVRVNLPFFQGIPVSIDFAYPTTKAAGDETQLISISLSTGF